jgi:hypothetical protein
LWDLGAVSHINNNELFSEIGFSLNQISDGKLATEVSITKADWSQLKAGVSFQEYVSSDNDVMCEAHVMCLRRRRRKVMVEKMSLEKYFCQHWRALTVRKYLMKIDVNDNTMVAWCSKKQRSINFL